RCTALSSWQVISLQLITHSLHERSPTDCAFFFFVIRRPLSSTLFPTRRSSDLVGKRKRGSDSGDFRTAVTSQPDDARDLLRSHRSEEHTSELQSRGHLVCRLLLEKKNARQTRTNRRKPSRQN